MITRTHFLFVLVGLLALAGVSAADITVIQGDVLTINADTGVRGEVNSASATFSIPAVGYLRDLTVGSARNPTFTDTVRMNVAPGTYPLTIRLGVNGETVSFEKVDVYVVAHNATTTQTVAAKPRVTVDAPSRIIEAVSVPAMPDLTAGELFMLPVKVTGNGTYTLEIPQLSFGTYEVPNPITVQGERVVPVLIRVDKNAQPGTYTIPITMGPAQTNARVRVLIYTTRPTYTNYFIVGGIILLIVAILLALMLGRSPREPRQPPRAQAPRRTDTDEPEITYY